MPSEILIIDDNSDIRFLISDLLKEDGYKVRTAANFSQGLSEINKKLPDVAIIDVKLDKGDRDGIELLTVIKKLDKNIEILNKKNILIDSTQIFINDNPLESEKGNTIWQMNL